MAQPTSPSSANIETLLGDLDINNSTPFIDAFDPANGALHDLSCWIKQPDTRHHDRYKAFFEDTALECQEKLRSYLTPAFQHLLENVHSLDDLAEFTA
jgi:hypothetical protein